MKIEPTDTRPGPHPPPAPPPAAAAQEGQSAQAFSLLRLCTAEKAWGFQRKFTKAPQESKQQQRMNKEETKSVKQSSKLRLGRR